MEIHTILWWSINSIIASNSSTVPSLDYLGAKIRVKFNGSCLKQDKITFTHGTIVNIYIVYEISKNFNIRSYPTEKCLFGAVSLTKNVDIDKYKYSGYGIRFDREEQFSVGNRFDKNCRIVGVDMGSSVHVNNKKRYYNSWWSSYTKIRWYYINCRKKFIQLILLKTVRSFA